MWKDAREKETIIAYGDYERAERERLTLFDSREDFDLAFRETFELTENMLKELKDNGYVNKKDFVKYVLTGHSIDRKMYFDTEEDAEKQMKEWLESDKEEFTNEDTSNDYFIVEE